MFGRQSRTAAGASDILCLSGSRETSVAWLVQWVRYAASRHISFPRTEHVRDLLELAGLTLTQRRNVFITVVGTTACLRVGEVSNIQICDCKFGHDAAWSLVYQGTIALLVYKRKQDQVRKGLYPRLGRAVTGLLEAFVEEVGLEVSDECTTDRSLTGDQSRDHQSETA